MKWIQVDDLHWRRECGRYFVNRSLSFVADPNGHWVYLAYFKRDAESMAECISAEGRHSLNSAIADCTAHIHTHQQQTAASTTEGS